MANQINGKILYISPVQTIPSKDGQRSFTKRDLILDATRFDPYTGERQFESYPTFEFSGEKCADLNAFKPGQIVCVSFDLTGIKYIDKDNNTKYFNRVRGYKIEARQMKSAPEQQAQQTQPIRQPVTQQYQRPSYNNQGPVPNYPPQQEPFPF